MNTKRFFLCLLLLLCGVGGALKAQVPQCFGFQAVVRNNAQQVAVDQNVGLRLTILQGEYRDNILYQETQQSQTNGQGLFSVLVGRGTPVTGDFTAIDWSRGPFFIQCEVDPKGGIDYSRITIQQLVSVPYAFYAQVADSLAGETPIDLEILQAWMDDYGRQMSASRQGTFDSLFQSRSAQLMEELDLQRAIIDSLKANMATNRGWRVSVADAIEGTLPGLFSVSNVEQVRFSKGNLQFTPSGSHPTLLGENASGEWSFVAEQYQRAQSPATDLFGWGTSGYGTHSPQMLSVVDNDYAYTRASQASDWGFFNGIRHAGEMPAQWRALTQAEWNYLLVSRPNAGERWLMARVNGVNGIMLLPDEWTAPSGIALKLNTASSWDNNSFNLTQWQSLEHAGAVFLPAAGVREGSNASRANEFLGYWTSTPCGATNAYLLQAGAGQPLSLSYIQMHNGFAVRLVRAN